MKVLILTCNTGEGHNSCAKAIKEIYVLKGEQCDIDDSLRFVSDRFSKFIAWGHVTIYRKMPWMFKFGYKYSENHPALFGQNSGIFRILTSGAERLYGYIESRNYDTVICTHVFSAMVLTYILKQHPINIRTCFVATDYTCSPGTEKSDLDRYFIPDETLAFEFENPGINKEKMVGSGIPIRQMFYSNLEKKDAKNQLGINPDKKHLLIMCGSMGCGPIKKLVKLLSENENGNIQISVVCGNNAKLKAYLERKYSRFDMIKIYGYVTDMSAMLDSADLYLTKPGGISVTEAKAKKLPMVYIDAVAGCEDYNRRYFVRMGAAKTAANINELAKLCIELIKDDAKLENMRNAFDTGIDETASECIYKNMKSLKNNNCISASL